MILPVDNLPAEEIFNAVGVTEGEQIFYNSNGTKRSLVEFTQKASGIFNPTFCADAATCLQRQDLRSFLGYSIGLWSVIENRSPFVISHNDTGFCYLGKVQAIPAPTATPNNSYVETQVNSLGDNIYEIKARYKTINTEGYIIQTRVTVANPAGSIDIRFDHDRQYGYLVIHSTCSNCGNCLDVCEYEAIIYNPNPDIHPQYSIDINKCTNCMMCTAVCPEGAIEET